MECIGISTWVGDNQYHDVECFVAYIIFSVADLQLNGPIDQLKKTNVHGIENMLELALAAQNDHGIARFAHVSTTYIAGANQFPVLWSLLKGYSAY